MAPGGPPGLRGYGWRVDIAREPWASGFQAQEAGLASVAMACSSEGGQAVVCARMCVWCVCVHV